MYKKNKLDKERISVWSDRTYTIERITVPHDPKSYKLDGLAK